MNILLERFLADEALRGEARAWLRDEQRLDIKFLLKHSSQIWDAYDDEEMGPYLAAVTLPHFESRIINGAWAAAAHAERLPLDEPWLQLVDLPNGLSLLVPGEAESTERILAFSPTSPGGLLSVVTFHITQGKISSFGVGRRHCLPRGDGSSCGGRCPSGGLCSFKVYVGDGPARGFCEC